MKNNNEPHYYEFSQNAALEFNLLTSFLLSNADKIRSVWFKLKDEDGKVVRLTKMPNILGQGAYEYSGTGGMTFANLPPTRLLSVRIEMKEAEKPAFQIGANQIKPINHEYKATIGC